MDEFRAGRTSAPLRRVEAYWTALCPAGDGGAVPLRAQIDPRGLEDSLANAFILERIAPGIARFRVAGSLLGDLAGMEVRGMPLTAMFAGPSRAALADVLETVFSAPAVAELTLTGEGGLTRPGLAGRMLLLPLRCEAGAVSRCLGAVVCEGRIGATPRRLILSGTGMCMISGGSSGTRHAAEPARGFAEGPTRMRGYPHLRLVKTDRT